MSALSELAIGQRGRVVQVDGTDQVSIRLMEMGLVPGVEVGLIGVAPLGDPIEIDLRGYRLSLRKREAARVHVTVDA